MILRENGTRFCVDGKVFTIGGRISANGESEYEGLFGTIMEIRSGADRETENDVPDIYCDFEIPASEEMLRELEARFSGLYGETKTIDDISLDCVIMSPDMLEPLDTPPGKREGIRKDMDAAADIFAKVLQTNAGAQEALGAKLSAALAEVRGTVDASLEKVRAENAQKLEAMRATVEEKLDRTLSERLSASFRMVDEKLGLVQSGLGEMRRMAQSVSRLQNVLANVKTRGTFGEVRLAAILSEILTPAQYAAQARLDPKSAEAVDFAVRLPGRADDAPCWLPIDSKFPLEDWELLENAEREGNASAAAEARKGLERAVLKQAKSIREKYVRPPVTTEFAVMFLPSEGLYAEVLRTPGLFERLQREFRITPAGPTVIAALLNSLLMGFMALAMEKRSSEVWKILAEVKTDFAVFSRQFETVEKKFREAQSSLEQMSVKSRRMGARMQAIDALADGEAASADVVPKLDEGETASAKCVNDAF